MNRAEKNIFKSPSAKFRGKPFWAWNGKLEESELLRQIQVFQEMGMGGFFCHSRTGLATPYLGEDWFKYINACADYGSKKKMETWLYDEDRWPSGTAGGEITKCPEFRMKYMRLNRTESEKFIWNDQILAAFSVDLDGLCFQNKKRIYGNTDEKNRTVLYFTVEEMERSGFYNGYTYVDTMNQAASEAFIKTTHEKYKQYCGSRFGKSIKGIFSDEPHRGAVMCGFSLNHTQQAENLTPYTGRLFKIFQDQYQYDLRDYLPELFLWPDGQKFHRVKWQYMNLIQSLFIKNFLVPIEKWCKVHNLIYTGHFVQENTLTSQSCMQGSVMRAYEHMDIPGIDVLTDKCTDYWVVKQLASVGRQMCKKQLLSELYGCTGWQMDFKKYKEVGDWQALFGINMRCHHLSWYTMEGEAKRDYPASIFYQSAWYKDYRYVEDYFARFGFVMSLGAPVCDVLMINPVESAWGMIYPGWSWQLGTNDPEMQRLESVYRQMFDWLTKNKIDFDYGDEDILSRMAKVETQDGQAYLVIGASRYKTVLIAGMFTIRSSTLDVLRRFIEQGGKVVYCGEGPSYVDAEKSEKGRLLHADYLPLEEAQIIQAVPAPVVRITDDKGENISKIFAQVRKYKEDIIVALLNMDTQQVFSNVHIEIDHGGYLEKWSLRDGKITEIGKFKDCVDWKTSFDKGEEAILVLTGRHDVQANGMQTERMVYEEKVEGPFAYRLSEPNVCVLDFADYKIDGQPWVENTEILKIDRSVRKYCGLNFRGGEMIQPWKKSGQYNEIKSEISFRFHFSIENIPEKIMMAAERPEKYAIKINGNRVFYENDQTYWIDPCFKTMIIPDEYLQTGENEIELDCNFSEEVNIEAIYLLGDFSVRLEGIEKIISALPATLKEGDITKQGFPFYGAGCSYFIKVPKIGKGQRLAIMIENFDAACVKVGNGREEKMIAFPPFKADITEMAQEGCIELQYVLTRRNTFGPLHQYPVLEFAYGPESFVTEGSGFLQNSYGLLPQGMTGNIRFQIME